MQWQVVDKYFNVDVYVPGCPPRPEAIIYGVARAWEKLKAFNRRNKRNQEDCNR
jgi:NADH:ubiquinone oxidoreductase subunit B-like Fe-S oxidoreductase